MRLLERDDTGSIRLTEDLPNNKIPPYAILSHTWGPGEVLFRDMADGTGKNKAGYAKILFCRDQARHDGLRFFWVDTCCIDKSNSTELQEAINSMFRWYRDAAKCYVYLTDVSIGQRDADSNPGWKRAFQNCRWFTRGWTLQELIAPTIVEFFSEECKRLGDKKSLEQEIHDVTGIPLRALQGSPLSEFSIPDRMTWVEKRNTTREEDRAYSLFGIFDVQIPLLYGEGERKAFRRLREEISKASAREKAYDQSQDRCLADLRLTDPRHDKKRIEEAKGGLLRDSYRWVLDNAEFQRWRDGEDSRLLWIKGDPGKGKTMLACGIIDELKTLSPSYALSFFFCQATDSRINNATAVLRGMIYLLVSQQPTLLSHVRTKYDHAGRALFEDTNAWVALSEIFTNILQDPGLGPAYLVIDALDECVTDLPRLLHLIIKKSSMSPRIKWIVSSRNWPEIEEQLETATQRATLRLELSTESIAAAVDAYIQNKVDQLVQLKKYDTGTRHMVQEYLHSNANDTFLWVALVCQALADPNVRKRHIIAKLTMFPPGLDSLYARMLEQIGLSEDAQLCKQILSVAVVVRRPISLDEVTSLVELPDDVSDDPDSLEEIIKLCGSFLTVRERTVYFVHQSAKDFLLGKSSDKASNKASQEAFEWVFPSGTGSVDHIILSRSLTAMSTTLRRDIYGLGAPGFPIHNIRVPDPDPLATVQYSCIHWVDHLHYSVYGTKVKCDYLLQDNQLVHTFLKTKYLYWLEALSLLQAITEGLVAIRQLKDQLGRYNGQQLTNLVRDAYRFGLSFRWVIEQAPLQVYTSALVFSPAGSPIRYHFNIDEPDWISTKPIVETEWNACVQTLEGHNSVVTSVAFSPDGQRLASGSMDSTIRIWDTASGGCVRILEDHRNSVKSVAYSPDGQRLASGSLDSTIRIWDTASGGRIQMLEGHRNSVKSVAFSPDGQRLASGSKDSTIRIWDTASGSCIQILRGHRDSVKSVAFSPDGQRLASGSYNIIKIWNPVSGSCIRTIEGYLSGVGSIAFSSDGQRLASGSYKAIKVWDPMSGSCIQTIEGDLSEAASIAFSLDGQQLASGLRNSAIKIWDTASGRHIQTLEFYRNSVRSVAFSPDGQRLASGSGDNMVKIWDTVSGSRIQTIKDPHCGSFFGAVPSATFSPDGRRLVSGLYGGIKIWDTASGRCVQMLEGHRGLVRSVAFSPDGQRLASATKDTVKIWDPTTGNCQRTFDVGASITHVSFNDTSLCLLTDAGSINIAADATESSIRPDYRGWHGYSLGPGGSWITCNGRNVLWLPPEYRPACFAVQGRMISIGCVSGRVFTVGFSREV